MPALDDSPFKHELAQLERELHLPGGRLNRKWLGAEMLALWLLEVDDTLQMDTAEIGRFWQQLPFWAFAWAGGRALAQYIGNDPDKVAGKRVLDFGCGSGIAGIAAALAGASEVWVADLDTNALKIAKINAVLNGVDVNFVDSDDWPEVDLLLAADVLYDISSSTDLKALTARIPEWLLAESKAVAPNFVELRCLDSINSSTMPAIGDFDESVQVDIYCRGNQIQLN